ncbi:MAG: UPF0175 family protein [Acidobacteriota bacterium]
MCHLQLDVPEAVLRSLKGSEEEFARELRIVAAVKLLELRKLSSGRAAQLAGLSRVEFLMSLGRYHVSPFTQSSSELDRDARNA